ncbi:cytochrome c [Bradyrhizobium guangdongense]
MTKAFGLAVIAFCMMAGTGPGQAADPSNGKGIAKCRCASCHLVDSGQTYATDQAPPFAYLARTSDFDQNRLAFLLLMPHPNMAEPILEQGRSDAV